MPAIGRIPLDPLQLIDHLAAQPNGDVVAVLKTGESLSCQPNGTFETRPAGTANAYEVARVNGGVIVYNPTGLAPIAFAYAPDIPNV